MPLQKSDRDLKSFDAGHPLYTSDGLAWRMDEAAAALQAVAAHGKPVVLFVHGRGKEPRKSLRGARFTVGKAIWKIELGYDCRVLMFNWDSKFAGINVWDRTRPLANTAEGGRRFGELLALLRQLPAVQAPARKPVLLVHSMGSIVVQRTVVAGLWPPGPSLFQQVVLSQPDADDVGHSAWLDALAAQEQVFVTLNADDKVLRRSDDDRPEGAHALGRGTAQPLADRARYIDLTAMGAIGSDEDDDHEVFGKGAMNGQVHVCRFFEQALRGADVTLDASNVASVDRAVVFRLKPHFDASAPGLAIPVLPDFGD